MIRRVLGEFGIQFEMNLYDYPHLEIQGNSDSLTFLKDVVSIYWAYSKNIPTSNIDIYLSMMLMIAIHKHMC